jgi:hypothetical protein
MKTRLVKFVEVEGMRHTHDVVIDSGKERKRKKGPSKQFRETFGRTPLSAEEAIPWGGKRLIVRTDAHGGLPAMDEVLAEAKRRSRRTRDSSTGFVALPKRSGIRHALILIRREAKILPARSYRSLRCKRQLRTLASSPSHLGVARCSIRMQGSAAMSRCWIIDRHLMRSASYLLSDSVNTKL